MALAAARAAFHALVVTTDGLASAMAGTWFADGMPADVLARLADLGSLVAFPEGTTVVREGAPCASLGVVISGRVALRLRVPGGEDPTILTVEPGDVFGWSAILPPAIATSTGTTVLPTTAVLFDGVRLTAALDVDRDLAAIVYRRLLVAVARRLSATRLQLLDLYRAGGEPW